LLTIFVRLKDAVPLHEKLYGDVGNLELTAACLRIINGNV
jgi:hypothetical protein